MADKTDSQLLKEYLSGDGDAFEALVGRHQGMVIGVCNRVTGNAEYAEDAAQATFLLLANRARKLQSHPSVTGWLHRSATNMARSANRSANRRKRRERYAMAEHSATEDRANEESEQFREHLDLALSSLSDRDRECLILYYFERIAQAELSKRLGLKESTLAMRLSRARERLLKAFRRQGVPLTGGALLLLLGTPLTATASSTFCSTVVAAACQMQSTGLAGLTGVKPQVMSLTQGMIRAMIVRNTLIGSTAFVAAASICWALMTFQARGDQPGKEQQSAGSPQPSARVEVARESRQGNTLLGQPVDGQPASGNRSAATSDTQTPAQPGTRIAAGQTVDAARVTKHKELIRDMLTLVNSYNQWDEVDKKDIDKLASYFSAPLVFVKRSRSTGNIKHIPVPPELLNTFAKEQFGQWGGKDAPEINLTDIAKGKNPPDLNDKNLNVLVTYNILYDKGPRPNVGWFYFDDKDKIIGMGFMKYSESETVPR